MGRVIGYAVVRGEIVQVLKCGDASAHYMRNGRTYEIGPETAIWTDKTRAGR